jgi:hypothetical protein
MRTSTGFIRLTLLAALLIPAYLNAQTLPAGPIPLDCDRPCLEGLIDDYLAALVAHDSSRLPLSADVRYSENEQMLEIGDGFWGTASGLGKYKHYYADPEAGQAGFMGSMLENGNLVLMALRLRVQLGRITEVETSYYRQGGGGPAGIAETDASGAPPALWLEPIPASERMSRHQLIAVANAYFEGLQKNDGKGYYPFTEDCHRLENGYATTNNPNPNNTTGYDSFGKTCLEQFKSGYFAIVSKIHHRRFPLVDVERGVVYAYAIFDHGGTLHEYTLTDGTKVNMKMFSRPSSIQATEAFRIEKGLIRRIEMIGSSAPYHTNPPWEGGLSGK